MGQYNAELSEENTIALVKPIVQEKTLVHGTPIDQRAWQAADEFEGNFFSIGWTGGGRMKCWSKRQCNDAGRSWHVKGEPTAIFQ